MITEAAAPASPDRPDVTGPTALLLTLVPALLVIAARIWSGTAPAQVGAASTLIAVVSTVHGMTLFVLLGRDRTSTPGCFLAFSAAIVGMSGLLVIPDPYFLNVPSPERQLQSAMLAATLTQIAIGAFCLAARSRPAPRPAPLPDPLVRRALIAGLLLLAVTIVLGDRLGPFLDGFGFSAILLVCAAVLLSRTGLRSPLHLGLLLASLAAFPVLVISGTGRLRAIALLLAVVHLFFLRHGRSWMKTCIVLAAPAGLAVLGIWRRDYEEALTGQHGNSTGLSSMFVAIGNFGTLMHATADGLAPTLGASLLSPLGSALPASLRPGWIPQATGYELAAITDPDLYGTGFSTVVSVYGDLWWNLDVLGLVVGAPLLALLLIRIDVWTLQSYERAGDGPIPLLRLVLMCAVFGAVGDLVWSGIHTWVVRLYSRFAALIVLGVLIALLPARAAPTRYVRFAPPPPASAEG